jgi:hypothetical protein
MSDIGKTGHVVRVEKETLDLLSIVKNNTGIPKYKSINMAVKFFFEENKELQKLIQLNCEIKSAKENLNKMIKDHEND